MGLVRRGALIAMSDEEIVRRLKIIWVVYLAMPDVDNGGGVNSATLKI